MPTPKTLVYANTNNVSTMMKYQKGKSDFNSALKTSNMGTCAAQSAIWLRNLTTIRIALTKPDPSKSQVLFTRCWMNKSNILPDTFNKAIMQGAGVSSISRTTNKGPTAFEYIEKNPGLYYIDLQGHIVAAAAYGLPLKYYFFDSNHGCWEYPDADAFKKESAALLTKDGWSADWWLYKLK